MASCSRIFFPVRNIIDIVFCCNTCRVSLKPRIFEVLIGNIYPLIYFILRT